jgi:molecular chaperone GrpE
MMEEIVSENSSDSNSDNGTTAAANGTSEVEQLKAQIEKYKNDFLYARAEFENYRRNVIKERADLLKYGCERLIIDVLGVLDNFERALEIKPNSENLATYTKGIEMTQSELRSVLQKHGVTEISSKGLPFDPMIHEALSSEESDDIKAGHVSRVFRKPYKLHDKVIRPGQVIVAKEPTTN